MAAENYLVSIFQLDEIGIRVTSTHLADQLKRLPEAEGLGTSLPSVGGMLRRLVRENLVEMSPNKDIKLTTDGRANAAKIVRRQRLAKRMVVDLLGLEPHRAHEEAHRLEHAISEELAEKIDERLGFPTTCPFGHPIPGSAFVRDKLTVPLEKVVTGTTVTIDRIPEDDGELLQYFVANQVMPGVRAQVKDAAPYRGVVTLITGTGNTGPGNTGTAEVVVSYEVAQRIWVTPVGVPQDPLKPPDSRPQNQGSSGQKGV
jgi:DtxR family Mn-dependent transcriptional regulator